MVLCAPVYFTALAPVAPTTGAQQARGFLDAPTDLAVIFTPCFVRRLRERIERPQIAAQGIYAEPGLGHFTNAMLANAVVGWNENTGNLKQLNLVFAIHDVLVASWSWNPHAVVSFLQKVSESHATVHFIPAPPLRGPQFDAAAK